MGPAGPQGPAGAPAPDRLRVLLQKWYPLNRNARLFVGNSTSPRPPVFDGAHMWVVNFQAGSVSKFRASDNALVSTTPVSGGPMDAVFDGAHLWVTHLGGTVGLTKIRASDGTVAATYAVAEVGAVSGLAYDGESLWLGEFAGTTLRRFHPATGTVTASYTAPQNIGPVVFDGVHVWTGHMSTGAVSKFRAADGTLIGTYPSGLPNLTAMVFDGEFLWVARSAVVKMDPATGAVLATTALPGAGVAYGFCTDGRSIWVPYDSTPAKLFRIRPADGAIADEFIASPTRTEPMGCASDGINVWVPLRATHELVKF